MLFVMVQRGVGGNDVVFDYLENGAAAKRVHFSGWMFNNYGVLSNSFTWPPLWFAC